MYYLEDIRKDPTALPPPEQPLTTQDPSQGIEIPAGAQKEKKGDVGASWPEEKVKEKAKEKAKSKTYANPSEDALTIKDIMSKAKAVESKSKIDSKKYSHQSQT